MELLGDLYESAYDYVMGPTPADVLRKSANDIRSETRNLERQKQKAKAKELALISDIKRAAPTATKAGLKMIALNIARQRRGIARIEKLAFTLSGMEQQLLQSQVSNTMNQTLANVTLALQMANGVSNGTSNQVMLEYQRQAEVLNVRNEMLDDMQDEDEEELNADELLAQLTDEMNLQITFELPSVKKKEVKKVQEATDEEVNDFIQQLNNLKPPSSSK